MLLHCMCSVRQLSLVTTETDVTLLRVPLAWKLSSVWNPVSYTEDMNTQLWQFRQSCRAVVWTADWFKLNKIICCNVANTLFQNRADFSSALTLRSFWMTRYSSIPQILHMAISFFLSNLPSNRSVLVKVTILSFFSLTVFLSCGRTISPHQTHSFLKLWALFAWDFFFFCLFFAWT